MPRVSAAGRSLEYRQIGDRQSARPVLVFLHEGLGSIRQWRDFPAAVSAATGCPAIVYDRYGYGQSEVLEGPRTGEFMHDEALIAFPEIRKNLQIENPILIGHSDGASIALIHAGRHRVRGVVAMAPHVFIEPICLTAIEAAARTFETSDLPAKLGRYHRDAAKTFFGWADTWRETGFKSWDIRVDFLPGIRCPVLAIQGHDDGYGSMAQLDEIARCAGGPVELLKLESCGHAPFRDQPEAVLSAVSSFVKQLG